MENILKDILIVCSLVVLEGLLSVDNALVLATMVSELPEKYQKRALRYGIIGAYGFRVLAIFFATYLISIWWTKIAGGIYLLYVAYQGLWQKTQKDGWLLRILRYLTGGDSTVFWAVVIRVELMDAAFSIDSILAAVAMTGKIWLIILGGMLGILALRFVAGFFISVIKKYPILKKTAYVLVLIVGIKLVISPWWHANEYFFFTVIAVVFFGSFLVEGFKRKNKN